MQTPALQAVDDRSTTVPSKDRQRVLARAKLERQMARRAAAARRRRQVQAAIGAVVALVAVVGGTAFLVTKFGGDEDNKPDTAAPATSASAEPTPSASASLAPGTCKYTKSQGGQVKDVGTPPTANVPHAGTRLATVKTSQGEIEVTLDVAKAPCTANSFAFLASKKYFDGTSCHRMTNSGLFVLQCGDPSGTGSGGPGYQFGVENLPTGKENPYPAGVLAMANSGSPDSNGSQFFIVYKDSQLGPDYTIFGTITKGLDVVNKVGAAGHDGSFDPSPGGGKPKLPVKLEQVTVAGPKG
jgi:peptidyl-prolyl cis-trans isomerase B (cyclophilin B)